jgi:hypothetical protein
MTTDSQDECSSEIVLEAKHTRVGNIVAYRDPSAGPGARPETDSEREFKRKYNEILERFDASDYSDGETIARVCWGSSEEPEVTPA